MKVAACGGDVGSTGALCQRSGCSSVMMLFFSLMFLVADLQAHLWGLDQQLDKFTTDYVQQHLQRASHGLLTIAELDFAFPPNASPAMVIQAKLKEHSSSSGGLHPVSLPFGSTGQSSTCTNKVASLIVALHHCSFQHAPQFKPAVGQAVPCFEQLAVHHLEGISVAHWLLLCV
jgi:hypothetical protein